MCIVYLFLNFRDFGNTETPTVQAEADNHGKMDTVQKDRQHQRAVVIDTHKMRLTCTGRRRLKAANTLRDRLIDGHKPTVTTTDSKGNRDREKNSHQPAVTMVQSTSFNLLKKVIMPVCLRAFLIVDPFSSSKVLIWSYTVYCLANNFSD